MKNKASVVYPNIPVTHNEDIQIAILPDNLDSSSDDVVEMDVDSSLDLFIPPENKNILNYLINMF